VIKLKKIRPDLEKLKKLVDEMDLLKHMQFEDLVADKKEIYSTRYLVLQCLQLSINIACKIVAADNLGNPTSYLECFALLLDKKYISQEIFDELKRFLHIRTQLINGFDGVDDKDVFIIVLNSEKFGIFIEEISVSTAD
jgi:uncharacterized protein YutE (UPF0331/DUF86 family)